MNNTKAVNIGGLKTGGGAPVRVQSMTNTKTADAKATIEQIKKLEKAGCELVRCSVPDHESALALKQIKKKINIPLIADIHFDYKLAIEAMENGADKIRINPGNIGNEDKVTAVINAAKKHNTAIRIGVNSGSLQKDIKYKLKNKSSCDAANNMTASLMEHIENFEKHNFENIVVSLKASDVMTTIEAYKLFSRERDYPLHIGITEAGTEISGMIKSAEGLGILLYEGLGDTMRVSLTAEPELEVYAAYRMLSNLGIRKYGVEIISCPTCARTEINVIKLAKDVEKLTMYIPKPLKVAVMGCSVNGPGEAAHADIGVSGGKKVGIITVKGKIIKRVPKKDLLKEFNKELMKFIK
ncbi:MAG: 4-hydroxy-3-methylbut-2-en-1-yl diphosphate synthase [Candidatus Aerophobetes bacterium ADurb.Bin490]|nr:MAG: 4-hydroxy-3-methylbut-2-en-1-yl diphosphate synthase [Candidatus Aerophobetes bacterium ADurb.Bin490]HPI03177.1 flavodoxin-dependent (E)-4-hydroxy-3-methylbut-2-enyl-diphosphate synthase [Candidatus Goldiibacteriota bacterium]HPN64537.1 flavodoxin-dependent (E)-4-hydroxy-3-methylbut-2-enyl-diphosphate synthase [Candidatus Goldiibacteriota bacterium]HRQ42863.1 flavodoxin-dependent (E)-4-hydroxy-3-methylbut-2-enyl-diphosphate synthase [Candidatus Goldiibacteriota bacterium]